MATVPDWKLQLLARRRQEEAAVRGREQAERDRLAQMPAWKRGLLERRRAKLGVPVGEPGPGNEATDAAPPEPDEPVVLLEAIGPVHQNRFIRQERKQQQQQQQQQQGTEEQLPDRRPPEGRGSISGIVETPGQRPSPAEAQEQNPVGRASREQKLSLGEARDRRLGVADNLEQSYRPAEALEWRLSPRETEERSSGLSESWKWKKSSGETPERNLSPAEPQEQTSQGSEMGECSLSPGDNGEQRLGMTETHKWRMNSRETHEQNRELLEAREWRLTAGEESKRSSGESGTEQRLMQRKSRDSGLLETQRCRLSPGEFREQSPGVMEAVEMRLNLGEDVGKSSRQMEVRKWRLNSGKAREWSPARSEAREHKSVHSDFGDQKLGLPGVEAGEGRTGAAEEEAGDEGRMVSSLRSHYLGTSPLPPEEVGTKGSGPQEEEATEPQPLLKASVSPQPPAPPTPQPPGDPLMSRLFYGVKPGPGVGGPRRSGHTFTVNPRRSGASAASAPPEPQVPGPGKKRYPTAEEILVLGGYLRLSRSCLAKGSPERHHKQLKISFNESALETTYQYPSESSVLEELGPDPEALSTPGPPPSLPDEEDDEEELLLLQRELRGGLQTKALLVDESCRR
ncbi:phostensin [Gracilinanus agilis]|uniref:phostensin n=1 Tax=Gracilinanus agilis TaxID=191870 RepID=UPI001CFEBF3D|nr:phostensin [Gracilinanus agilis]